MWQNLKKDYLIGKGKVIFMISKARIYFRIGFLLTLSILCLNTVWVPLLSTHDPINSKIPLSAYLPSVTQHENLLLQDQSSVVIEWIIDAEYVGGGASYSIFMDSQVQKVASYTIPNVSFNFSLSEGNHAIIFNFDDGLGNSTSDIFDIYANFRPNIQPLSNISVLENSPVSVTWNVTDNSRLGSANYTLRWNTNIVQSGFFSGQLINYSIASLSRGVYSMNLTVYDGYGGNSSQQIAIIGNDMPVVSNDIPNSVLNREVQSQIRFSFSDVVHNNPVYVIKLDNSIMATGPIGSLMYLDYAVPSLTNGIHKIEFTYVDNYGLNTTNLVHVIMAKRDLINKYNDTAFNNTMIFTWSIKLGFVAEGYYTLYIDSVLIYENRPFITRIEYATFSINPTINHTLKLLVQTVANYVDYNVFVLLANQIPEILNPHINSNITTAAQALLNWSIKDPTRFSARYVIYVDNLVIKNGSINNTGAIFISYDISTFAAGLHTILFVFYDGLGANCTETFIINLQIAKTGISLPVWAIILIIAGGGAGVVVIVLVIRKRRHSHAINCD
jgi:hypothetical protein